MVNTVILERYKGRIIRPYDLSVSPVPVNVFVQLPLRAASVTWKRPSTKAYTLAKVAVTVPVPLLAPFVLALVEADDASSTAPLPVTVHVLKR